MEKFIFLNVIDTELAISLWTCFATTFLLSLLVVLTTRWHGFLSLDESAGLQKLHVHPASRVGGLPIVLGLLAAWWTLPLDLQNKMSPWWVSALPAFTFGLAEDFTKSVSVTKRLLATIISGVLAWWLTGYSLTRVDVWGFDVFLEWLPFSILFTAFAVSGVVNSINIIDGLNGLASSMVLWALLGVAGVALAEGDLVLGVACFMVTASVLGFFLVNWPMGKLFLGDGGSYFLGFSLAWACVLLIERHSQVSAFTALLLCVHPITEVLFSIFRRRMRNRNPSHPDCLHFHSLVKRRVMQRLLPNSTKTMRNSVSGLVVGSMSLLPAVAVQFVYTSTAATLSLFLLMVLGYVVLYKRVINKFRH